MLKSRKLIVVVLLVTTLLVQLSFLLLPVKQVYRHRAARVSRNHDYELITMPVKDYRQLHIEDIGNGLLEIEWQDKDYDISEVSYSPDGQNVILKARYDKGETIFDELLGSLSGLAEKSAKAKNLHLFSFYFYEPAAQHNFVFEITDLPTGGQQHISYDPPGIRVYTPPPEPAV